MTRKNDVVGWGQANAPWAKPTANSISKAIAMRLCETGFRDAFGVLGGGIAPFAAGLSMSPLRFFHFRHEAGAGFAALEAHRVTGKPGLVIVTTGPGIFNVLNAVQAARSERAKLLLVTGFTPRTQVGRGAVQETSLASMPSELLRPGSLFHDVALPETAEELAVDGSQAFPLEPRVQGRFARIDMAEDAFDFPARRVRARQGPRRVTRAFSFPRHDECTTDARHAARHRRIALMSM